MNKKETILKIQRELRNKLGYPDVSFLNKLTETNNFHLMMDICMLRDRVKEDMIEKVKPIIDKYVDMTVHKMEMSDEIKDVVYTTDETEAQNDC